MGNELVNNAPLKDLLAAVPDLDATVEGHKIGDISRMFPVGAVKEKAGNVNFVMMAYISQLYKQGFPPSEIARQTQLPETIVCEKLNLIANATLGKVTRETQYLLRLEADAAVQTITDELMNKITNGNLALDDLVTVCKEAQNAIKLRTTLWGLKSSEKDPPQRLPTAVAPAGAPTVQNNIQNNFGGDVKVTAENITKPVDISKLADEVTRL